MLRATQSSRPNETFSGVEGDDGPNVVVTTTTVDDGVTHRAVARLDPRYDLANHSPDGFAWGYPGSGPAQTALALLAHVAGPDVALALYHEFKDRVVQHLDMNGPWEMSRSEIVAWIARREPPECVR